MDWRWAPCGTSHTWDGFVGILGSPRGGEVQVSCTAGRRRKLPAASRGHKTTVWVCAHTYRWHCSNKSKAAQLCSQRTSCRPAQCLLCPPHEDCFRGSSCTPFIRNNAKRQTSHPSLPLPTNPQLPHLLPVLMLFTRSLFFNDACL